MGEGEGIANAHPDGEVKFASEGEEDECGARDSSRDAASSGDDVGDMVLG